MKLERYSWSLYIKFLECSKKVYFAKILKVKEIEKEYLEYGSHIHTQVENYHKGKEYDKRLIERYTKIIPKDYFLSVEQWIEVILHNPDDKNDIIKTKFVGRLDGIKKKCISDLKNMSGSLSQSTVDKMGQITLYLFMKWVETGEIYRFQVINMRKDRNKKGELFPLQIIDTTRTINDFRELWKDLKVFDNSISNNKLFKEPGFGCKDCTFKRVCAGETN